MLRITVHDAPRALTLRLEGRLAGPWVRELEECWQATLAGQREPILRVDLTEVTSLDAAGQACLAALHRQGAEFVAADCLMRAVVAEITRENPGENPLPDRRPTESEAKTPENPVEVQRPRATRLRRGM
jgi:hypothetical protein